MDNLSTREDIDDYFTNMEGSITLEKELEFVESISAMDPNVACCYIAKFGSDELINTCTFKLWRLLRDLDWCDDERMKHVIKLITNRTCNGDGKEMLLSIAGIIGDTWCEDDNVYKGSFDCVRRIYNLDVTVISETDRGVKYALDLFYPTDV